ncbi:MAG: hypothetical protein APF80_10925 [Alphaproteobacteria bacterium BRH_c36]|nr:MAG: hypothetical protein APF80_10925 [Alphaproteobacteria bacterium BRH_c36]
MSSVRYDLIKVEEYSHKGVKRSRSWKVGSGMALKRGLMIFIPEGMAVSGRLMLVPEQGSLNEVDMLEAYAAAADEFGV